MRYKMYKTILVIEPYRYKYLSNTYSDSRTAVISIIFRSKSDIDKL